MKNLQIIEKISFILSGFSLLVAFLTMGYSLLSGVKGLHIAYIIAIAIFGAILFFGISLILTDTKKA